MPQTLFVTWDGGGNVPPAIAIADELRHRGHVVRFLGHETQRRQLTEAGFAFTAYAGARPFSAVDDNSVPRMLSLFTGRQSGRDLLAELAARPADLVVVDCMLLGALRACADTHQRYVSLQHLFDSYLRTSWLHGPMGLVGRLRGLRPVQAWDSASLCVAATLPSLDPGRTEPPRPGTRFTGPALVPPVAHDLSSHDPAVLVSLSTFRFSGMRAALQRLLDATAGLDARVVVTTGPVIDPSELRAAANHEVHRYVPHDELMPQVSLVVGHGGHATTMRALAHDLPVVVMPMHPLLDQPAVGRAVAAAGAGTVVAKRSSPKQLRRVIEQHLGDGPHRAAARRLGAEIRDLDGTVSAADLLDALLQDAGGSGPVRV